MTPTKSMCPKCGGPLTITDEMELFKCPACQTPYLVERSAGSVRIVRLERQAEASATGSEGGGGEAAALELEKLRLERAKFQGERSERLRWIGAAYAMGGLLIGLVPFFVGSAVSSGLLAGIGFGTGILGFYLGARFYLSRYYHPFEKALEEFKRREDDLEAQLSEGRTSGGAQEK